MKKFVMFSIISTLLFSAGAYSQIEFHKTIKGGFKTCIEYNENFKLKTKEKKYLTRYNSLGNIIEKIEYDYKGLSIGKEIFKYDSIGNIVETISYNSVDSIYGRKKYYYDKNNNFIKGTENGTNGFIDEKIILQYDSIGCMKKATIYKADTIDFYIIFNYDIDGKMYESIQYHFDGTIFFKHSYKFDTNCNLIEQSVDNSNSSISYRIIYHYDNDCNIKEAISISTEPFEKTEYIYSK